jgi:hypothetical protein
MTRPLLAALVGLVAVSLPRPAAACTCVDLSAAAALAAADAVFSARVKDIQPGTPAKPGWQSSNDPVVVLLDVSSYWKGRVTRAMTVTTAESDISCGFPFERGRDYLIYARRVSDGLSTGLCSRTKALMRAADDLKALGVGKVPPRQ